MARLLCSRSLCCILVLLSSVVSSAYASVSFLTDGLKCVEFSPGQVEISGYDGVAPESLSIPSLLRHEGIDYEVRSIGEFAFMNQSKLRSVSLPNSLLYIEYAAFAQCTALEDITLPLNLQHIGIAAFNDCSSLKLMEIPESVISIGSSAFEGCTALTDLHIRAAIKGVAPRLCRNCGNLKSVILPESCGYVDEKAFSNCYRLKSLILPDSVTSIGKEAFRNCIGLIEMPLPASLTSLGEYAFSATAVTNVVCPPGLTEIPFRCFDNCYRLRTVGLNEGLEKIDAFAFFGCSSLVAMDFPESISTISAGAFDGCLMECLSFRNRREFPATSFISVFGSRNLGIIYLSIPEITLSDNPYDNYYQYQLTDVLRNKVQLKISYPADALIYYAPSSEILQSDHIPLYHGQDLFFPKEEDLYLDLSEIDLSAYNVILNDEDITDKVTDGILLLQDLNSLSLLTLDINPRISNENFSGVFRITGDFSGWQLYSLQGHMLDSGPESPDFSRFPGGVYILRYDGVTRKIRIP